MHALRLDEWRPAFMMPFRPRLSFSQEFLLEFKYEIGVFAVGRGDHTELFRQAQRMVELFIGDAKCALVCQEDFEAANATLNDFYDLPFGPGIVAGNAHVERKITRAMAPGFPKPQF